MIPQMPKMEKLLNQRSTETTRVQNEPNWISKVHFQYVYGQLELSQETSRQYKYAKTGRNMNGFYKFKKFTVLSTSRQNSKKNRPNIEISKTRVAG